MPLSPTGVPIHTTTQRPWTVYITLGVSLVTAITLGVVHGLGSYTTSQTTLEKLIKTLKAGDVEALMQDPELGFSERASRDVRQRGLEEYNKIMSAFASCETAGLERYRALEQTIWLRGEEAFKKLPYSEQKQIRQKSRSEWILTHGHEALGAEACAGIEEPAVFTDPEKAAPWVLKLGHARLSEEQTEGLPPVEEIRSWAARSAKALSKPQKELLAKVRSAGQDQLDELREKVDDTGTRMFKALPARERRTIANRSRDLWIIEKGIEQLDEEDQMLASDPEAFLEDADEKEQARKLCLQILPPAKKALLQGRDYKDFTAKREDYIRSTGRERYVHFLSVLFAGCEYEVAETTLAGDDPYDLLRISRATYRVKWKGCPGAAEYLGETLTFRFDGRSWRYVSQDPMNKQAGKQDSAAPETEKPQADQGGES